MKLLMVPVLGLLLAVPALAQTRSDVEVTRADIQADRKAIVADNLPLTDAQGAAFWPVYQEYRTEMSKIGDRALKLVTDYASGYDTLTDAQATALMTEHLAIQKDVVKVKEKYRTRFEKAIPAKLVLRFYQIENRLDTIMQLEVLSAIPLAK
jgi:hypothetical protein